MSTENNNTMKTDEQGREGANAVFAKGLLVQIADFGQDELHAQRIAEGIVRRELGASWKVSSLGEGARDYEVLPASARRLDLKKVWELCGKLAARRDVASAEPAVIGPGMRLPRPAMPLVAKAMPAAPIPEPEWSLRMARIREAWELPLPSHGLGKRQGEGIVIGHPDTGYTLHPALWPATAPERRLLKDQGYDYVGSDGDPLDPLRSGLPLTFPGHGTGTASVLMGERYERVPGQQIVGVAPRAKLLPLRVSESVIHFDFTHLTKAIYFCANRGAHVISMSLGGPFPSGALTRAIQYAISQGVIVLAAAGNVYPFVVYPAKLGEVIAVAACNASRAPWASSARGPEVDLSAPGENVWKADAALSKENGSPVYGVTPSSGTSFAVAMTAGTAALWLAHHNRDWLIERYGAENLAAVFKELLVSSAARPGPKWNDKEYGAGILDTAATLSAKLPDSPFAAGIAHVRPRIAPMRHNDFDELMRFFPDREPHEVRRTLLDLFGSDERDFMLKLAQVGQELHFHVATDEALRDAIRARTARRAPELQARVRKRLQELASKRLAGLLAPAGANRRSAA